jgi:DNA-binding MarR family transcriptional regulator
MKILKYFDSYEYENFTHSDMEYIMELYEEGITDEKELSRESDLSIETVKQILYTLRKRGDIK